MFIERKLLKENGTCIVCNGSIEAGMIIAQAKSMGIFTANENAVKVNMTNCIFYLYIDGDIDGNMIIVSDVFYDGYHKVNFKEIISGDNPFAITENQSHRRKL